MSTGKSGKPLTDFGSLYLPSERIPAAKPIEDAGESAWALFSEESAKLEDRFAPTQAAGLDQPEAENPEAYAETAKMELAESPEARRAANSGVDVEAVLLESRRGNRVCPKPAQWQQFYEMLRLRGGDAPGLPPPIPTAQWAITSAMAKRARFREQIEWADLHQCLLGAYAFIKSLPQEHWAFVSD